MFKVWSFKTEDNRTIYAITGRNYIKSHEDMIKDVLRYKKARLSDWEQYRVTAGRIKDAGDRYELYYGLDVKGKDCIIVEKK